jgi:hypothetical protein
MFYRSLSLRHWLCVAHATIYLNRGLAPDGEILSFAPPRQLLLRCSTSCIHAVEKKVSKEKAALYRLNPPFLAFTGGCRKGHPWPSGNARLPAALLRTIPGESSGTRRGIREFILLSACFLRDYITRFHVLRLLSYISFLHAVLAVMYKCLGNTSSRQGLPGSSSHGWQYPS